MSAIHTVEQPAELLAILFAWRPKVKKSKIRQWLKHGAVQVNGQSVTRFNQRLRTGDVVSIRDKNEVRAVGFLPPEIKVLFEDASLIVIEKPSNLLTMASSAEREKTAYAYLTDYMRRGDPRHSARIWIVHRLDRESSGLLVFSKTEAVKVALQATWNQVEKRYLALVEGNPPAEQGILSSHLDETGPHKVYSAPPSERTRAAVTRYRVVQRTARLTLVELTLESGRRNQIRVHLADIRCPIIGDQKYGARTNPARRLGLHATFLQLTHPVSGQLLQFESPLPHVLARLL